MTGVLVGAIALLDATLMISAGGYVGARLTIERQQRLCDPDLDLRFMVEARDQTFDNLAEVNRHVGLHRHIDLGVDLAR